MTVVCFGLAPLFLPAVRVRLDTPICPMNWLLLIFCLELVVNPQARIEGGAV